MTFTHIITARGSYSYAKLNDDLVGITHVPAYVRGNTPNAKRGDVLGPVCTVVEYGRAYDHYLEMTGESIS